MPGLGGLGTLTTIRGDSRLRATPVVVFTTSRDDIARSSRRRCVRQGRRELLYREAGHDGGAHRDAIRAIAHYWFEIDLVPGPTDRS
jgi:CheY-like chemotaxis protein